MPLDSLTLLYLWAPLCRLWPKFQQFQSHSSPVHPLFRAKLLSIYFWFSPALPSTLWLRVGLLQLHVPLWCSRIAPHGVSSLCPFLGIWDCPTGFYGTSTIPTLPPKPPVPAVPKVPPCPTLGPTFLSGLSLFLVFSG